MIQGPFRLWSVSITALVLLTVYNVFLTVKIIKTPTECRKSPAKLDNPHAKATENCAKNSLEFDFNFDLRQGRKDNGLVYKMFDNLIIGESFVESSQNHKTCIATQSSLDRIFSLVEMAENWSGPISVATFATNAEEVKSLLFYILYLKQCDMNVRNRVTFHLAVPEKLNSVFTIDAEKLGELSCENPIGVLKELVKKNRRSKPVHPQNHLRNLARKNCQSKFVFLVDVDIIPSRNMAEKLDEFFATKESTCKKLCAYVIPTYEIDDRVKFPANKSELIRLAGKGLARPFHHKVFIYNQYATNFSRWQNDTNEMNRVHVSHPVTNFEFLYEPFYVAEDTVPPHDERFVGYGYTRNSQVYEMFVAGYEFLVLSPIFTCHWGLQVKRTRPAWREQQNVRNRKKFQAFKWEIFAKYDRDPLDMTSRRKH